MPVDVGQERYEELLRATPRLARMKLHADLHSLAFLQVWAQADRAGVTEPLALTRFLLERLYPDLRGERLERIMERFAELRREGRWSGPRRPDPEG